MKKLLLTVLLAGVTLARAADTSILGLPEITSVTEDSVTYVINEPDTAPADGYMRWSTLSALLGIDTINAAIAALESQLTELTPTLSDLSLGDFGQPGTNTTSPYNSVDNWMIRKLPVRPVIELSGATAALDWNAGTVWRIEATDAEGLQLSDANRPVVALDIGDGRGTITNATGVDAPLGWPAGWRAKSGIYPTIMPVDAVIEFTFGWDGTEVVFDWQSYQSPQLAYGFGGTGNTNGVGTGPWWERPVAIPSIGTNLYFDYSVGSYQYAALTDDAFLAGYSSGIDSADTNKVRVQTIIAEAVGAAREISWNGEFATNSASTLANPFTLAQGSRVRATLEQYAPANSNSLLTLSVFVPGAGSAPESSLNEGHIAHWHFDGASGASDTDVINGYVLTSMGGSMTPEFAGIDGNCFTNTSSARAMTNNDAALNALGRSGASMAVFQWVALNANANAHLFGEANTGVDSAFYLRTTSGGSLSARASTDGTTTVSAGTGVITTGAWHLVGVGLDNAGDVWGVTLDGEPWQDVAFTGDLDTTVAAGFSVGGVSVSSALFSPQRGALGPLDVWTRRPSSAEVAEMWNGGAGKFADETTGDFAP